MTIDKTKAKDQANAGLVAGMGSQDSAKATGHYLVECHDKDGNLKWSVDSDNLVVNVGLQYMAGVALTSTAQITTWYIGLYGAAASNTPAAGDTMSSHAGWTEVTDYSESTRVAATFARHQRQPFRGDKQRQQGSVHHEQHSDCWRLLLDQRQCEGRHNRHFVLCG